MSFKILSLPPSSLKMYVEVGQLEQSVWSKQDSVSEMQALSTHYAREKFPEDEFLYESESSEDKTAGPGDQSRLNSVPFIGSL